MRDWLHRRLVRLEQWLSRFNGDYMLKKSRTKYTIPKFYVDECLAKERPFWTRDSAWPR